MSEHVDVAVVGAGPAGAAAALAVLRARPRARVALLDRSDFPRDKACGDGVAPHVLDVLARLGVAEAARGPGRGLLEGFEPVSELRLSFPDGPSAGRRMARPAHVVPRAVLDARLVAAAVARGAVLRRHRVREVTPSASGPSGRVVQVLDGGLTADVVVGADGPHSAVRACLGPAAGPPRRRAGGTAVALRGYAPVGPGRERAQVIAFDAGAAWPSYAWSFPIGDGRANVGYGELLDAQGRGPSRAEMLHRLELLLPGAGSGGQAWRGHHLPLSTGRGRQPDGAVLLAGDALGLVNPLTGEGIHAAVLSGALAGLAAARAVRAGDPASAGRSYRLALRSAFGRHHAHIGAVARLAAARPVVRAGLRAGAARQRTFDDLVELGLADGTLTPTVLAGTVAALARGPRRPGPPTPP